MRYLNSIFIALLTFLFVTNAGFLRKFLSAILCGVLSFNSASCYSFLGNYGKVDAAVSSKEQVKDLDKASNKECELTDASSTGDPHLLTFDGLRYDLQTVGEFILIKSNNNDFEVQSRQKPFNSSTYISINSAVAIKVGSDRVAFYAQDFPNADTTTPLWVNGKPATFKGNKLLLKGGGEILNQGNNYAISAPTGEKVLVNFSSPFLNISPMVCKRPGRYSGLLGNVNENPNDDLQIRGGGNVLEAQSTYGDVNKVLNYVGLRLPGALDQSEKVYFENLYKHFANSWRVKKVESLFDYPAGKTIKDFINLSFPDKYLKLNMLSSEQIQKAHNACTNANVAQDLLEECIFDVGFSGFPKFANSTAEINSYVSTANHFFPNSRIHSTRHGLNRFTHQPHPVLHNRVTHQPHPVLHNQVTHQPHPLIHNQVIHQPKPKPKKQP